jgi:hypothetical protein
MVRRLTITAVAMVGLLSVAAGAQVARNNLFTAPPTTLLPGVAVTVPGIVNNQSRVPNNANVFEVTVQLNESDKLSDGLEITFGTYASDDNGQTWRFLNGTLWRSYGAGGLVVNDPDGTVRVNPDPRLQIGVAPYRGQHVRLIVLPNRAVSAGGTLTVF